MVSTDTDVPKTALPAGEYKIVTWDLDTTGKKLLDEFCHIAGYTPEDQFSQYVMPHRDLDLVAKRRHQMRTVTIGKYRMLKDLRTGKFLKTKSEISALTDFLTWLEKIKGEKGPSIILVNYEMFKLAPCLLIEALIKYQLFERFSAVVKGFGDCYAFVKETCDQTLTTFTLRVVSKVLLDKNDEISHASGRARLAYQVMQHLTSGDSAGEGDGAMVDAIRPHTTTLSDEVKEIEEKKRVLSLQNTLKPIFLPIMKVGIRQRRSATVLRRLLTAALLDYDMLKGYWEKDQENFEETVNSKLTEGTEEQKKELCKLLRDHFDTDVVQPQQSKSSKFNPKKYNRNNNSKDKEPATSSDIPTTPDTTTSNTSVSSPSKSNGVNTPQGESPKHEPTSSNGIGPTN